MGREVNDHVSLQWPSYEQPEGSNLRPQRKQTSWSQVFTTGPPPRWLQFYNINTRFMVFFSCLISRSVLKILLESSRNAKALCAGKETKVVKEYVF